MNQNENNNIAKLEDHSRNAATKFQIKRQFYVKLTEVVGRIIEECLCGRKIKVHSVQKRTKDIESFRIKAETASPSDPSIPKYINPLNDITDLSGIRIITYFLDTLKTVDELLRDEFDIIESSDKRLSLMENERFGYQSIHYIVRMKCDRIKLPEYESFGNAVAEIQVRTILQHTWAEIEHDIQYKSSQIIPIEIKRRFAALAGMLEIADREFQAIQNANVQLEYHASNMVKSGHFAGVEITPNALKLYLDKKLGPDSRISNFTYQWTAGLLKKLGFQDLNQVNTAIEKYDHDRLSDIAFGNRQGQIARFEYMLLAALGEKYISRHPWNKSPWFIPRMNDLLERFKFYEIHTGNFDPKQNIAMEEK